MLVKGNERYLGQVDHVHGDELAKARPGSGMLGIGRQVVPLLRIGIQLIEFLRIVDIADVMPVLIADWEKGPDTFIRSSKNHHQASSRSNRASNRAHARSAWTLL